MSTLQFKSLVSQTPFAPAQEAVRHFGGKLSLETDPSDVHFDLSHRDPALVVLDVRSRDAFADLHVPGALNLPYARIDAASVEPLAGKSVVVYCWSASCNAAAKGALRLARLGLPVKEMIGGLAAWVEEGYATEGALPAGVTFADYLRYHHGAPKGLWAAGH